MTKTKRRIGTIDAETDPFKFGRTPKPFAWGLFLDDEFRYFWGDDCTAQLIDYLKDEDNVILYAHNGGKFDFHFLVDHLERDITLINSRIGKCRVGNVGFRDSWLILPDKLKKHGKDDIDYALMESDKRELHKDEIIKYLKKDCTSLYEWITYFIENFGINFTISGTAFKELKKTSYEVTRTTLEYDEKFRSYYYGGRVQCFETGAFKGDIKYYDINSAYPFLMKEKHWYGSSYLEHLKLPSGENGSWYAHIKAKSYGALPFRSEEDGKLYFPDDGVEREYYASGWEINKGLETNTLKVNKVIRSYRPHMMMEFDEYVDKFFALKHEAEKAGDKVLRHFAKILLNSCYGKFGQDGRRFKKYIIVPAGEKPEDGHEDWELEEVSKRTWLYSRPDPDNSFYNVATAASITGAVRAYLWGSILRASRPLYCDTDSIICLDFDGDTGEKLGQWDLEDEATEAYIAQRKMYALLLKDGKHKIASKGVRLTFDQIKNGVLNGENIITEKDAPAFSLKYGPRFFTREVNFKNIEKNSCPNSPD